MRIIIGAPGNGAVLKEALKEKLAGDERVSALVDLSMPDITYPEISFRAGQAIAEGRADRGILVCGTGHRHRHRRHQGARKYGPRPPMTC